MSKQKYFIGFVQCCSRWPIIYGDHKGNQYRWHRCGRCGVKPTLIGYEDEQGNFVEVKQKG